MNAEIRNPQTGRILKNPEKYIKRLQTIIDCKQRRISYINKNLSELRSLGLSIKWTPSTDTQIAADNNLFSFNVGDKIVVIGMIKEVRSKKGYDGKITSEIDYERLETRKVPDWF